jgi:hypothetical protein
MPLFQCTSFFSSPNLGCGGSFVMYNVATDHPTASTNFNNLIISLRPLVLPSWQFDGYRVSDMAIRGDSLVVNFSPALVGQDPVAAVQQPGATDAVLLRKTQTSDYTHGHMFLHGVAMNYQGAERNFVGNPAWLLAFGTFQAIIDTGNWFWVHRTNPGVLPPVFTTKEINNIDVVRFSSHRIGRPFDLLRGRRRIA